MKKQTRQEIKDIVNNLGYILLYEYKPENKNDRRVVIKDSLGYKYDIVLSSLYNHYPDIVGIYNPYSIDNIIIWLYLNKKEFKLCENNTYRGNYEKLKLCHDACKEYFYM